MVNNNSKRNNNETLAVLANNNNTVIMYNVFFKLQELNIFRQGVPKYFVAFIYLNNRFKQFSINVN